MKDQFLRLREHALSAYTKNQFAAETTSR
jgi:hypothetical protein